eukprot:4753998-Amphidinium_carterae.2
MATVHSVVRLAGWRGRNRFIAVGESGSNVITQGGRIRPPRWLWALRRLLQHSLVPSGAWRMI